MNLTQNITRAIGTAALELKKYSPELLIVAGVVGVITSACIACKETLIAKDIIDEAKEEIDNIPEENESEKKKKYITTAYKVAKTYAPSVILGSVSMGCVIGSHIILRNRVTAMAAAATTALESLKAYRQRVKEAIGEEQEEKIYNGDFVDYVDEDGVLHRNCDPFDSVGYRRFITWNHIPEFENNAFAVEQWIKVKESILNNLLMRNGHLFLNDVYRELNFPPTKAGQVVGWIYDKRDGGKDCFVDLRPREYADGILIDPNLDGEILENVRMSTI